MVSVGIEIFWWREVIGYSGVISLLCLILNLVWLILLFIIIINTPIYHFIMRIEMNPIDIIPILISTLLFMIKLSSLLSSEIVIFGVTLRLMKLFVI